VIPRTSDADWFAHPGWSRRTHHPPFVQEQGLIIMSEEAQAARRALQESMDLRDQGHTDE
jgi:hypothetical protein